MTIFVDTPEALAAVCAELVRQGIQFEAKQVSKRFVITLTGGF